MPCEGFAFWIGLIVGGLVAGCAFGSFVWWMAGNGLRGFSESRENER